MPNEDKTIHPFNEAGRRLYAALISYQMGHSGVDSTLKNMPDTVDISWSELAERLSRDIAAQIATNVVPRVTHRIQ
jgi:hypothetical protein